VGGFLVSGIDDTYLVVGPKKEVFAALMHHKQRLKDLGLELHLGKTRCYAREDFKDAEFETYRGEIETGYMESIEEVKELLLVINFQLIVFLMLNNMSLPNTSCDSVDCRVE
jgi:hypothetical protein